MRLNAIIPFTLLQCLICALCASGALLLGILFPLGDAYDLLRYGAVYFMAVVFAAWLGLFLLVCLQKTNRSGRSPIKRSFLWLPLLVFAAVIFFKIDPAFAVMDDEGIVLNTGLALYEEGELFAASKGYWVEGEFVLVDGRLDKRPFLYAYIISLVHHVVGYRIENAFYLNYVLGLGVFLIGWSLFCRFFSPLVSFLALLPLLSCSVFLQCVRGAGFETFNFMMLAVLGWSLLRYYEHSNLKNQAFLILTAILLSYSRYESVGVIPVVGAFIALVVAPGSLSVRVLCIAPWLLVPYLWLFRCTLARTDSFQEASTGELPAFSFSYIWQNVVDAAQFIFSPKWSVPNDPFTSAFGLLGLLLFFYMLFSRRAKERGMVCLHRDAPTGSGRSAVAVIWLLTFGVLVGIMFCYFWSSFLDILSQRFSLLMVWPLLFGVGCILQSAANLDSRSGKMALAAFVPLWLILSLPNLASIEESRNRNSLAEFQTWKMNWLGSASLDPEKTIFIDPREEVWTAMRYSVITPSNLNVRMPQLELGKRLGRFDSIFLIELYDEGEAKLPLNHRWNSHYFTLDPMPLASFHQPDGQLLARIRRVMELNVAEEDLIPHTTGESRSILSYLP